MTRLPIGWATACASHLRQTKGYELTPGEVRRNAVEALAKIREHMRELGYQMPEGDLELIEHLHRLRDEDERREAAIREIEAIPWDIDDDDLPELTPEEQEAFDKESERIWQKIAAKIDKQDPKPWAVTMNGHVVMRFKNGADAGDDCHERNCRAHSLGVSARYEYSRTQQA